MTNPRLYKLLLPVLLMLQAFCVIAKEGSTIPAFAKQSSLLFIENKGQITDQHGAVRHDIDFKLQTPGITMFIGDGQLHYQWVKQSQDSKVKTQKFNPKGQLPNPKDMFPMGGEEEMEQVEVSTYRMDVTLVGANRNAQVIAEEPDAYYENYITRATGEKGVSAHTYRKLTYKNIYPNIDWVLYISSKPDDVLKYDFIINPGGNPNDIQLRYDGATELKLQDGALTATTPYGSITEQAPYSYMAGANQQVASSFILNSNTLSFQVEQQPNGTLVIDPQLHWATYYGGSVQDYIFNITGDDSGYVYATGHTRSANNIATTGAYLDTLPPVYLGSSHQLIPFVVKFSDAGVRQWATYYYPGCRVRLYSCKYNNGLYLCGYADTSTIPVMGTTGTQQPNHGGGIYDGLLVKLTKDGMPEWMTYVGGSSYEYLHDLDTDGNGDLIIVGITNSSNNLASANAHQSTQNATIESGFIAKYSPQGVRKWGTYYGGIYSTRINDIATDKWNNVYVCGSTADTSGIATRGTFKDSADFVHMTGGGRWPDGFIAKFDDTGKRLWGSYYGGSESEELYSLDCDDSGYIYARGLTASTTGIATPGAHIITTSTTFSSLYNGMMVKFDSSGQRKWGTYLDTSQYSGANVGFTVHENTIYLSGEARSKTDIATPDAAQHSLKGLTDLYMMKFDTEGKKTWGTYFGGSGEERIYGGYNEGNLYVNKFKGSTNIYLHGHTTNSYDLATFNSHQFRHAGSDDGFIAKFTEDTLVSINSEIPLYACVGDTIEVGYRTTYSFRNGNLFTAELSDDTGGFANPITIGSVVGDTTSVMTCVIPLNTPIGDSYRIRITASLRGDTSVVSVNKIYINSIYPQSFSATSNSPVCFEDTIKFNATSTSQGVVYYWEGVNGYRDTANYSTIANANPSHDGDYIVTANLYGCKTRDTLKVVTKLLPYTNVVNRYAGAITTPCENDTLKLLVNESETGTTYAWAGAGGLSAATQNPVIAPALIGYNGKVIVTANLNGCTQKDTVTVVVKPLPQKVTATVNSPVCAGTTLQFNATSSSTVTWKWQGPNGFAPISSNPIIGGSSAIHNGDYEVTATLNGCTVKDTATVLVNLIPAKPVLGVNTPICANDTLRLTGSSTTAGVTYSWSGPASFTGTAGDTSFYASSTSVSGQYTLTASKDGCSNAENISATVKPIPASVTLSNDGPVCEGSTLNIISTASTTNATYTWTGPNGFNAATQNTSVSNAMPTASGWYKLVVALNGCSITDSTQTVVNTTPIISNTAANQPLCINEVLTLSTVNINSATYSWSGPNNYTANGRTPVRNNMQFTDTGWYRIVATANNCVSAPDSVYVNANPLPFVVITTTKDSICKGDMASFIGLPNSHGGTPTYSWLVNGIPSGTGTTFSTTTLNDGDIISCNMTEYTKCAAPYIDESNDITMNVLPWLLPSVNIVASPSTPVKAGDPIQFSSTQANGGKLPAYQWKQNGANIQGATSNIWSASTLNDNDEICLEMTSNYMCPQPPTVKSNCIIVKVLTGISDNKIAGSLQLYPNPNNGHFTIKGQILKGGNEAINIEVLNPLGQVVYIGELHPKQGNIHKEIQLQELASGTYLLRLRNNEINHVLHFNVK